MKKIIFLFFVAITMVSCSKNEEDEETIEGNPIIEVYGSKENLMDGFYTPKSMNLKALDGGIVIEISDNYPIEISKFSNNTEQEKTIYNEYVKYYGDTSCPLIDCPGPEYNGCKFPVDNISIVADKDFDSNHPKGSELNDLFRLRPEYLFMGFIESGYDIDYDYYMAKDYPLQDVSDFKLLSEKSILLLTPRPSTPGDYTFTVTINFLPDPVSGEECESLVQTIIMKF